MLFAHCVFVFILYTRGIVLFPSFSTTVFPDFKEGPRRLQEATPGNEPLETARPTRELLDNGPHSQIHTSQAGRPGENPHKSSIVLNSIHHIYQLQLYTTSTPSL